MSDISINTTIYRPYNFDISILKVRYIDFKISIYRLFIFSQLSWWLSLKKIDMQFDISISKLRYIDLEISIYRIFNFYYQLFSILSLKNNRFLNFDISIFKFRYQFIWISLCTQNSMECTMQIIISFFFNPSLIFILINFINLH